VLIFSVMEAVVEFMQKHGRLILEVLIISGGLAVLRRVLNRAGGAKRLLEVIMGIAVLMLIAHLQDMTVLRTLLGFLIVALLLIFQPELRHAFVSLLGEKLFKPAENSKELISLLQECAVHLSHKHCGALIALERAIDLEQYAQTGSELDAMFNPQLVYTVFHHKTALHDGGMILKDGRIQAAGCLFPVSQRELADRSLGLRHRAAIGITEQTDAIAVIVSEETGHISIAHGGKLEQALGAEKLKTRLEELLTNRTTDTPKLRENVGGVTSRLQA
jgi:diadenylate cyclase